MTPARASVVVVSRGRPDTLALCLTGLARLRGAVYDVIVVADPAGIAAARALPFAAHLTLLDFDQANISAARNLGIAQAAGDVVAFIDDDAVPEPSWLSHLLAPFADSRVAAAGGHVIGRNGISFQWTARSIDALGFAHPLDLPGDTPQVPAVPAGHAIKTEGTNMAVRRDVLAALGGFDPAYRFYLDETDLNLRLARAGHATTIVPLALVHHAYAPSPRRTANRAVTDLTEIGASHMVFARRHAADADLTALCERLRGEQWQRLVAQLVDGRLEPRDLRPVFASLEAGFAEGRQRVLAPLPAIPVAPRAFRPFPSMQTGAVIHLSGRPWDAARLRREARSLARQGKSVTVFVFSPSALFHRVRFHPDGYWLQTGGLWGRSLRSDPLVRYWSFATRLRREALRILHLR